MSKNKKAKKNKPHNRGPLGGGGPVNRRQNDIQRQLERSEQLWKKGDPAGALALIEDLVEKNPRDAHLLFTTGLLYVELGAVQEGLERIEQADKIEPDQPAILASLAMAYLVSENPAHATMAFRQLRSADEEGEIFGRDEREQLKGLEELFQAEADQYGVQRVKMEQAMLLMERGELASIREAPANGIPFLEQAVAMIPKWTPAQNNLALYQWQAGQAEEALKVTRRVLDEIEAEDHTALSNLVRFLAFAGRKEEARQYMERLLTVFEKIAPEELEVSDDPEMDVDHAFALLLYYKTAEALASLEADETLLELLKQGEELGLNYDTTFFRLVAAAAWNSGEPAEAKKYWSKLSEEELSPLDAAIQTAITRPRPADAPRLRIPYFDAIDLVPPAVMQQIIVIGANEQEDQLDGSTIQAAYERNRPYYPFLACELQLLTFGNPLLVGPTLVILSVIGSPQIRQALRDFALGVDGAEETRTTAVSALIKLGELPSEGEIRFWSDASAEWQQRDLAAFPPFDLYQEIEVDEEEV